MERATITRTFPDWVNLEFSELQPMNDMTVTSINERAAEEFYRRGQDAYKDGNYEKATEFYERALSENPDHEQAIFNLALLYDSRAEDAKAIELYERITTSPPVHLNALMNLAILYEDNAHYEEAHRCLEAVLKTNPNHERAPSVSQGRSIRPGRCSLMKTTSVAATAAMRC